jgi:hypothetical protein
LSEKKPFEFPDKRKEGGDQPGKKVCLKKEKEKRKSFVMRKPK